MTQNFTLKLGDFGVIKRFDGNAMNTFVGTPKYMAPEILLRKDLSFKVSRSYSLQARRSDQTRYIVVIL